GPWVYTSLCGLILVLTQLKIILKIFRKGADMKRAARACGMMAPLHRSLWRRSWVLLVYVGMEMLTAGLPPGVTASLYFISDHEGTGVSTDLDIDESTGIIKTAKVLDRELRDRYNFIKRATYTLSLEAFDGGSPKRTDQMILDITIQDINDNAPVFNQSRYHAIISENLQPGSNILQVFATDADEGSNSLVLYEINRRQSDPDRYFVINPLSGIITLNKALDFEMRRVHELVVQAQDNATQPEVTNAFVTIHVRDYNDNQPTMTIIFLSEDGSPRISEGG
uniref:Cadherin domain-containing protein n=1 Tax=Periophthalmus magnuspinnatus TaxID=409849 RepID=A0A3B4AG25_9GOBI